MQRDDHGGFIAEVIQALYIKCQPHHSSGEATYAKPRSSQILAGDRQVDDMNAVQA